MLALLVLGLVLAARSSPLRADPWQVRRSPADRGGARQAARLLDVLRRDPYRATGLPQLAALQRDAAALDRELSSRAGWADAVLLARLRSLHGDDAGAEEAWREALQRRSDDARAQLALGTLLARGDRRPDARALLDTALSRLTCRGAAAAWCREALQLLVPLALDAGDLDGARRYLDRLAAAAPAAPGTLDATRRVAMALAAAGRSREALLEWRHLEPRLRRPEERTAALRAIARLALDGGDTAGARAALEKARALGARAGRPALDDDALFEELAAVARREGNLGALLVRERRAAGTGKRTGLAARLRIARLLDEMGLAQQAIAELHAAQRENPRSIEPRMRLVALLDRAHRDQDALAVLRGALAVRPDDLTLRITIAGRLAASGEAGRIEAGRMLDEASRRAGPDVAAHRALLAARDSIGDRDGALREQEALAAHDGAPRERLALGERLWQRGDRAAAIAQWKRLLLPAPTPSTSALVSDVLADHELWDEAVALRARAVAAAPEDVELRRGLAALLDRAGRGAEAEHVWLELALGRPAAGSAAGIAVRAEARRQLITRWGKSDLAQARLGALRKRAGASPAEVPAGLLLAALLRSLGRGDEALAGLHHLLQTAAGEERAEALQARAELLRERGRLDEALAATAQAANLSPARARAMWSEAAELAATLHRDGEALAYAQRAALVRDAASQLRLASMAQRLGRADEAESALRLALAADPRAAARAPLARLLLLRGDADGASRLMLEEALRSTDENAAREANLRVIDLAEARDRLDALEAALLATAAPATGAGAGTGEAARSQRALVMLCERRAAALRLAAARGDEAARARLRAMIARLQRPLLAALGDADPPIARGAARLLGELGTSLDAGAARALLDVASVPGTPIDVRVEMAAAAWRARAVLASDAWLRLARSDEKELRVIAVGASGGAGDAGGFAILLGGLDDAEPEVRATACLALAGPLADRAAAPRNPSESSIRASREVGIERLRRLLEPTSPDLVRATCVLAMGASRHAGSVDHLLRLAADPDALVRRAALTALASNHPVIIGWLVVPSLADPDAVTRFTARALLASDTHPPADGAPDTDGPVLVATLRSRLERRLDRRPPAPVHLDAGQHDLESAFDAALDRSRDSLLRGLDAMPVTLGIAGASAPGEARARRDTVPPGDVHSTLGAPSTLIPHLVARLSKLSRSPDPVVRARVVAALLGLGVPATDERVAPALRDAGLADHLSAALSTPRRAPVRAVLRARASSLPPTEKGAVLALLERLPLP